MMNTTTVRNSLSRWFRTPATRGALAAALSMALLVGGMLIWGFWDPTERTDRIPVAIVNEDTPATTTARTVDLGTQITEQVVASPTLDWVETNIADATAGLESGAFYGILRLPPDLSTNVATLDSANPTPAQVEFITTDATNYLASEIAQDAFAQVDAELNKNITLNFLNEVYDALPQSREQGALAVAGAEQLGQQINAATAAASELASGASALATSTATLAAASGEATNLTATVTSETSTTSKTSQQVAANVASISTAVAAVDTSLAKVQQDLTAKGETALAAQVGASRTALATTVVQPLTALVQTSNQLAAQNTKAATDAQAASTKTASVNTQATALDSAVKNESQRAASLSTVLTDQATPASAELSADLAAAAAKVPPVSDAQRQAFTEVLSDPVRVEQVRLNSVAHLGQGLAPYFLPVALFLGALTTFLLLRPLQPRLLQSGARPGAVALSSWAPALVWGVVQVLVLLLGLVVLRLGAAAWFPLVGMLLLSAACFLAVVQVLKAAFGGLGNYLAIVLLVVQLVAVGGVFPIETSNGLFRALHPLLPMTYSVDGIRRSIAGGPLSPFLWQDAAVLLVVTVACLAITAALVNRRRMVKPAALQPEVVLQ